MSSHAVDGITLYRDLPVMMAAVCKADMSYTVSAAIVDAEDIALSYSSFLFRPGLQCLE